MQLLNLSGKSICSKCNTNSPSCGFRKGRSECITCSRISDKEKRIRYSQTISGHLRYVAKDIKSRAKRRNKQCNITFNDLLELYIEQNGLCALTKTPLEYKQGLGKRFNSLSIDRIDNDKGYTKDNVQLICNGVNVMKQNLTIKELKEWCNKILNHSNNKD